MTGGLGFVPARRLRVGERVEVSLGSGLRSGKVGTIVPWSRVRTDGRGIPLIEGHYKPADHRAEALILGDGGELFTMYKNRLRRIEG